MGFWVAGIDPNTDRIAFAGLVDKATKHNPVHDSLASAISLRISMERLART